MQNVLITGTGREMALGFNFVLRYLESGDHVIATVRRPSPALEALKAEFVAGTKKVFDTATEGFITVGGAALDSYMADVDTDAAFEKDTEVVADGYFHESEFRSAPYFDVQIDGIELVNTAF